jgi:hypothetical protein
MRLNKAFTLTLVAILFSSFCFILNPVSASNQTGTISEDTIWTKQDSPYTVLGQVTVNDGVTLTIEAGVTVNICGTLQVNGAIAAKGSDESKIDFNGGNMILSPNSATAKQRTIFENCIISGSAVSVSGDVTISHKFNGYHYSCRRQPDYFQLLSYGITVPIRNSHSWRFTHHYKQYTNRRRNRRINFKTAHYFIQQHSWASANPRRYTGDYP